MDIIADAPRWQVLLYFCLAMVLLHVGNKLIYNVFFHPLHPYPGPWYRAATRLPYTITIFRGDATQHVKSLHEKYGQVVRIAPDTLSYTCAQAWTDIYTLKGSGKQGNLPKDPKFYLVPPGGRHSISSAPDADHRRLRRLQAHAFSEKLLALQEGYMRQYTEKFVDCLEKQAHQHDGVVDMKRWVNYLTTDIIGELTFSESFGGLETGKLHPWLEAIFTTLKTFTFMKEIMRLPSLLVDFAIASIPGPIKTHREESLSFGIEGAKRRMARGIIRPDFMSSIMKHNDIEGVGMTQEEFEMAAITFVIAGSETTATLLCGAVYLLLSNRSTLEKVTTTLRSHFASTDNLTGRRLQQHELLNAILKESLRIYPPAPDMLFRWTSTESAIVAGQVVPPRTSLTVNIWAANQSPDNFHRPTEFLPERWLKDAPVEFGQDNKAAFRPFSVGPRDCIGKNLAWAEMRMILAYLLWNFDLVDVEPSSRDWIARQKIFFLWEKPALNVKIAPRADKIAVCMKDHS